MNIHKINSFVKQSKQELSKFNRTSIVTYLQQAGNKVYNAYILLMESVKKEEIRTHKQAMDVGRQLRSDSDFNELGREATFLHTFFYEGRGDDFWIKKSLKKSYFLINKIKKRYILRG